MKRGHDGQDSPVKKKVTLAPTASDPMSTTWVVVPCYSGGNSGDKAIDGALRSDYRSIVASIVSKGQSTAANPCTEVLTVPAGESVMTGRGQRLNIHCPYVSRAQAEFQCSEDGSTLTVRALGVNHITVQADKDYRVHNVHAEQQGDTGATAGEPAGEEARDDTETKDLLALPSVAVKSSDAPYRLQEGNLVWFLPDVYPFLITRRAADPDTAASRSQADLPHRSLPKRSDSRIVPASAQQSLHLPSRQVSLMSATRVIGPAEEWIQCVDGAWNMGTPPHLDRKHRSKSAYAGLHPDTLRETQRKAQATLYFPYSFIRLVTRDDIEQDHRTRPTSQPIVAVGVIEGNIGAGKSTLTRNMAESRAVYVAPEPLPPSDILSTFYRDPKHLAFPLQCWFLFNRAVELLRTWYTILGDYESGELEPGAPVVLLLDRGTEGDSIFAELQAEDGNISPDHMKTYQELSDAIVAIMPAPVLTVVIQVPPELCAERIKRRSRDGESGIPLAYLERLDKAHERLVDRLKSQDGKTPFHLLNNTEATAAELRDRGATLCELITAQLPGDHCCPDRAQKGSSGLTEGAKATFSWTAFWDAQEALIKLQPRFATVCQGVTRLQDPTTGVENGTGSSNGVVPDEPLEPHTLSLPRSQTIL